jgi:hypothetical protein
VDDGLRVELLARCEEDQRLRKAVMRAWSDRAAIPDELAGELSRTDESNTRWLSGLTERHGWPGRTLVGDDGAHAAWLLAQHADLHPDLQRRFLDLLRAAVEVGEASAADLAYLEDRVRVAAGQPQRYGTQFIDDGHGLRPRPIEDPDHLDQRRAAVGLGPFADYEAQLHRRD